MAKATLSTYRSKRDFSKTREPAGERRVADSARLRFVVQKHAARRLHYDLRLEWNGVFKSWAVARGPSRDPKDKRLAVEVEDHPLDYGDFEGTIPAGEYGGGTVQLWDRGYWTPEGVSTTEQALSDGDLKFTLEGERLNGSWVLVRMKGDRFAGKKNNWLLIKHRDALAKPGDDDALLAQDRSVASGRPMAQIAKGTGKAPKPFMLGGNAPASADAVWSTDESTTPARAVPVRTDLVEPASTESKRVRGKSSKAHKMPSFVEPQLSKLLQRPPGTPGWAHEIKFDGYRSQLRVENSRVIIRTRRGLDWTARFAAVASDAMDLPDSLIDGEIVVLDAHRLPSFSALQLALSEETSEQMIFYAFDLLFAEGHDLRGLPLRERKSRLEQLLIGRGADNRIRYVTHLESNAEAVLASACKMGLEGIVSKQLDAPYRSGRTESWAKTKCRAGQEVVLGGWTIEAGKFRSLLAGVHRGGRLEYAGRIGTGYGHAITKSLLPTLEKLTRDISPFSGANAPPKARDVRWLEPTLVAEIEFAGWTAAGMIREASFKGLREDKVAKEVIAESPADDGGSTDGEMPAAKETAVSHSRKPLNSGKPAKKPSTDRAATRQRIDGSGAVMGVNISKPDKALWPASKDEDSITKLVLALYFEGIGEWLMPHLVGRPCSLLRAPDGIGGQQFFQRHAMAGMSSLFDSVKVRGDKEAYVQIDRIEALAAVAQIGALELHPWNCVPGDPERAGRLVFDLDPAPEVKFEAVIAAAIEVRERLDRVGLTSFCKTTGGKGLHVVAPLLDGKHAVEWPEAKNFAHLVCAQMAEDSPAKYLDTMSKSQRTGRIFLDYLRNDRTSTAVAVLSPRARPGATVSMPIPWGEVKKGLAPADFTVRTAAEGLRRSKPWKDYAKRGGSLADAIRRITA